MDLPNCRIGTLQPGFNSQMNATTHCVQCLLSSTTHQQLLPLSGNGWLTVRMCGRFAIKSEGVTGLVLVKNDGVVVLEDFAGHEAPLGDGV